MLRSYPSLAWLSAAQALYWSCSIIGIALTGLLGLQLAPWPWLATLPLTLLVVGNVLAIQPLARWMAEQGRSHGLRRGAVMGMAAGALAVVAIATQSFVLFSAAMLLLGGYQASCGFYRFAALEGVADAHRGRAAAWVVTGGVVAAVLAPSLAMWAKSQLMWPFAGAYACMAVLAALAWWVLGRVPDSLQSAPAVLDKAQVRALRRSLLQRPMLRQALVLTASGHGLMILIMNATPLAMHGLGMELAHSTQVIQWHVLGMFMPSFFAGAAVDRWGARKVAAVALLLLACSAGIAIARQSTAFFLLSSLLLGTGWNLMLLAGTTQLAQAHAPQERAVAQPLMEWANSASAAVMSLLCGVLVQTLGWQAINGAMLAVIVALAVWMACSAMQRPSRKPA